MTTDTHTLTWNAHLLDQLEDHWQRDLRPRLTGLTDAEYFWEPTSTAWGVRPRGTSNAPVAAGAGSHTIDFAFPPPDPAPVTTIGWRLGHLIVGILAIRNHAHFGAAPADYQTWEYADTADGALAQLDEQHARWVDGVRALGEDGLARLCGPEEGPFAEEPLAVLVLHIHRELIHHGAEICLLRDLYRDTVAP
jgi:hypothetical protein